MKIKIIILIPLFLVLYTISACTCVPMQQKNSNQTVAVLEQESLPSQIENIQFDVSVSFYETDTLPTEDTIETSSLISENETKTNETTTLTPINIEPIIETICEIEVETEAEIPQESKKEKKKQSSPEWMTKVFIISGFSADDYDAILKGTMLEGYGQIVYDLEHEYIVSGMWILGVSRQETSFGGGYNGIPVNSNAKNKNNYFGLLKTYADGSQTALYFNSPKDSMIYFCEKMNSDWYYGKSMKQIGNIYCPLEGKPYYQYIQNCMQENYQLILAAQEVDN